MYNTKWEIPNGTVSEPFQSFVAGLEQSLHSVDGQITVDEIRGKTGAKVELFNVDDSERDRLYAEIETVAKDTLGVGKYTAWADGSSMTITL